MLAMLAMLPPPRAAIFGASAPTRKYGARTLAANSRSKVASTGSRFIRSGAHEVLGCRREDRRHVDLMGQRCLGLGRSRRGFGRRLDEPGHVAGMGDHRDMAGG